MLLTINAVSPEVDDFIIELLIESSATFQDLHELIRKSCGWGAADPAIFYICDDHWRRRKTIREQSYEDDTMDEVELGDYLEDEGQRLQYLFAPKEGRGLLLEVAHIAFSKHIDEPCCRRSHGTAPELQSEKEAKPATLSREDLLAQLNAAALATEDKGEAEEEDDNEPSDDDLFDIEELDLEGFDFNEGQ
ncbi:MAG: plasmid pRiA4b ORF-3 family protein [Bacteroidaceae bacterium]|nr:plasmid pRiA4b ORF-3 family protein [Bacteroidaceae bacterium]